VKPTLEIERQKVISKAFKGSKYFVDSDPKDYINYTLASAVDHVQ
jgi:hypothetical protein